MSKDEIGGKREARRRLRGIFESYALFGGTTQSREQLTCEKLMKLAREAKVIDDRLSQTQIELIFTRVKNREARTINFHQFEIILAEMATTKGVPSPEILLPVLKCQPLLYGTLPEPVRFHDDKKTWTGVASQGGPTINDRVITLENLLDRTPADVRGVKPLVYSLSHAGISDIVMQQRDSERERRRSLGHTPPRKLYDSSSDQVNIHKKETRRSWTAADALIQTSTISRQKSLPSSTLQTTPPPISQSGLKHQIKRYHREILLAFYQRVDPSKITNVDAILERFSGREHELFDKIAAKYGEPLLAVASHEKKNKRSPFIQAWADSAQRRRVLSTPVPLTYSAIDAKSSFHTSNTNNNAKGARDTPRRSPSYDPTTPASIYDRISDEHLFAAIHHKQASNSSTAINDRKNKRRERRVSYEAAASL